MIPIAFYTFMVVVSFTIYTILEQLQTDELLEEVGAPTVGMCLVGAILWPVTLPVYALYAVGVGTAKLLNRGR